MYDPVLCVFLLRLIGFHVGFQRTLSAVNGLLYGLDRSIDCLFLLFLGRGCRVLLLKERICLPFPGGQFLRPDIPGVLICAIRDRAQILCQFCDLRAYRFLGGVAGRRLVQLGNILSELVLRVLRFFELGIRFLQRRLILRCGFFILRDARFQGLLQRPAFGLLCIGQKIL